MKIETNGKLNELRTNLLLTGRTKKGEPIPDHYAILSYKIDDKEFEDKGCLDSNLRLTGPGIRKVIDRDNEIETDYLGKWKNGVLNGWATITKKDHNYG